MSREQLFILPEAGLAQAPWFLAALAQAAPRGAAVLCPEAEAGELQRRFPGLRVRGFGSGALTPARPDLRALARGLGADGLLAERAVLVRDGTRPHGWDAYRTALRLLGLPGFLELDRERREEQAFPPLPGMNRPGTLLLKACGGIGNVVQTTCILSAAQADGWEAVFCPVSDSGQSLAPLFRDPERPGLRVIGPGDLPEVRAGLSLNIECRAHIAAGDFFHSPFREPLEQNEARAYARFAANVTGWDVDPAATFVGRGAGVPAGLLGRQVLVPGSKPGWDSKRWPHMQRLAEMLDRPVVLCREADLEAYATLPFLSPIRSAPAELVTGLDLAQAAAVLRGARAVVANDCGLAHVAAAAGVPTLVLFGPSSLDKNLHPRSNVTALCRDLPCRPCQGRDRGPGRLSGKGYGCDLAFSCLAGIPAEDVARRLADFAA